MYSDCVELCQGGDDLAVFSVAKDTFTDPAAGNEFVEMVGARIEMTDRVEDAGLRLW